MHSGYIKLWRKFTETSFFKDSHCVHLAVRLLLACNHEPKKFLFNGKEEICDRGQTVTGLFKLKEATGISIRSLRTSLQLLEVCGFLTSKATNKFRVITIAKYSEYQDNPTSKATIKRQSNDNQTTTNNNDKNVKNEKNTTTAESSAGAEDNGNRPVNWQNCKTDHQRVVAHYVKVTNPALYAPGACTHAQATAIFKVQGKAVGPLLAQCGDVATTCRVIDMAAKYYYGKGLDWSLYAVSKNCIDYLSQIAKEKSYGTSHSTKARLYRTR